MRLQNVVPRAATALAILLSGSPAAAGSLTASATVSVTVLAPVTLRATQGLDFGAVTRPGNAGANTVTLDAASSKVSLSGAGDAARAAGAVSAARFSLVGQPGVTYSTSQTLSFGQDGLSHVCASAPVAGAGTLGVIPPSGVQELRFGGAFELSAATPAQAYTGALAVTVNYN